MDAKNFLQRDKEKDPLILEGKTVIIEEFQPKYFPYVIEWRNNPEINKGFNYAPKLTMESEKEWYEKHYLPDPTQGFMVMIDKETMTPFGTIGWANMDLEKKRCTGERLMLGNLNFRTSCAFYESHIVMADYLYKYIDVWYGQVINGNIKAVRFNSMYGFLENTGEIQYPDKLYVNGRHLTEYYRTREMYEVAREKMMNKLHLVFGI